MTVADFDEIIMTEDADRCRKFFSSMGEPERKLYSARALHWASQRDASVNRSGRAVSVGALAACSFADIRKLGLGALPDPDTAAAVLLARSPSWLDRWCTHALKIAPASHWLSVRLIEKSRACFVPRNSEYWKAMYCNLAKLPSLLERVREDEDVKADLFDMLVDPGVLTLLDKNVNQAWQATLLNLYANAEIDQARLIEFSFHALLHAGERVHISNSLVSPSAFAITFNHKLVAREPHLHVDKLVACLAVKNNQVSAYACQLLLSAENLTRFTEQICEGLPPLFLQKSKEPAELALKLLEKLAAANPERTDLFGPPLLTALSHTSLQIQKHAIDLISSTAVLAREEHLADYLLRISSITGVNRTAAARLADRYRTLPERAASSTERDVQMELEQLLVRAGQLDADVQELIEISKAHRAFEKAEFLDASVILDSARVPRLNPDLVCLPIDDVDELIYLFTKIWSGKPSLLNLEQLLDGISRTGIQDYAQNDKRFDSIRLIVDQVNISGERPSLTQMLTYLIGTWANYERVFNIANNDMEASSFLAARCLAVAERIKKCLKASVLAAPTHSNGWIDPVILAQRLIEYHKLKVEPDEVDVVQALLRLAPDGRERAHEVLEPIESEVGDAIRYALGVGRFSQVVRPAIWVAALRARDPKGSSEMLASMLPNLGPDGSVAAEYDLNPGAINKFAEDRYGSMSAGLPNFLIAKKCKLISSTCASESMDHTRLNTAGGVPYLYPTVQLHDSSNPLFAEPKEFLWLHNRESLLAFYAKQMLNNIHSSGNYLSRELEVLFDPDVSLNENGRYVICLAMSSKNADVSRCAGDLLIAAVAERRLTAKRYGAAMALFLPSKLITVVRWIKGLRQVSQVSYLHAMFVWQSLNILIEDMTLSATQKTPFLELLTELQIELKLSIDESLIRSLERIDTQHHPGGKWAKLTSMLSAFQGDSKVKSDASYLDLEARVLRAERWQCWQKSATTSIKKKMFEVASFS